MGEPGKVVSLEVRKAGSLQVDGVVREMRVPLQQRGGGHG